MLPFGPRERLFEVEDSVTSIDADLADLNDEGQSGDDEEIIPEVEKEEEAEPEEEVEEEEEEEEELEEEAEEKPPVESLYHPFDRPSIKSITEAYPDIFKKFPSLKDMYFREQEFSKLFTTVNDAKEASESNTTYQSIREDLFSGNGSKFIDAIKDTDVKSLERFASNFLPTLTKSYPEAFWRAANPLVEDIARRMFENGKSNNDESMQNAARFLSKFFFGDIEFAEGKKTSVVKDEVKSDVDKEREVWDNERHTEFRGRVINDLRKQLSTTIIGMDKDKGKSKIDPDDLLSEFMVNTIVDRVINDLGDQLNADKAHLKFMDSLWASAKKNGRKDEDKSRIISAYLARVKSIIPQLRSKYVSEALGKRIRSSEQKKKKVASIQDRNNGGSSRESRSSGFNPSKKIDYSKTSDIDILNDNVNYK